MKCIMQNPFFGSQKLRPLQNPSNTKKTEHIHLSLALKSLHSSVTRPCNSFTPVKNLGKNCILFWEAVQLIDNSSSWTHWRISTTHSDVYGLISWYQLLSIGTLLYYINIYVFPFTTADYGWFPTWIQQGITPGSRLSHEAIGFLGFTGLEVSKLKSKLFLIEGKTKQKHVLRQIC